MSVKKIWIAAIIFGLLATGSLYLMLNLKIEPESRQASGSESEENNAEIKELEENEKENKIQAPDVKTKSETSDENVLLSYPEGKRAMTIAVSDNQGVAGFVKQGDFVDIVAILTVPEDQKETQHDSATIVLQNAKILAVGHAADDPETKKRYQMVTVEVSPKEGLMLGFASKYDLYLLLRNEGDHELEPTHTHVHEDELHEGVFK